MRIVFAALLYYDYTLTLSMEYEQFWKQQKRLSLVAVLIVLNRYVSLLGEIPVIIFIFGNLDGEAFAAITQALVAVHFTGSLAKMLPGCVFPMTKEQYGFACMYHATRLTDTDRTELSASPWCTMLLFDTAIFLLTLVRSIRVIRLLGGSGSMFQVMLRDGTIYFGALVVVNMANILTYLVSWEMDQVYEVTERRVSYRISSTLIARLMLNLRDPALNTVLLNTDMYQDEPTEDLGNMESVRFRSADGALHVHNGKCIDCSVFDAHLRVRMEAQRATHLGDVQRDPEAGLFRLAEVLLECCHVACLPRAQFVIQHTSTERGAHLGIATEIDADNPATGVLQRDRALHTLGRDGGIHAAIEAHDQGGLLWGEALDLREHRLEVVHAGHRRRRAGRGAQLEVGRLGETMLGGDEEVLEDRAGGAREGRGRGGEGIDGGEEREEVVDLAERDAGLEAGDACADELAVGGGGGEGVGVTCEGLEGGEGDGAVEVRVQVRLGQGAQEHKLGRREDGQGGGCKASDGVGHGNSGHNRSIGPRIPLPSPALPSHHDDDDDDDDDDYVPALPPDMLAARTAAAPKPPPKKVIGPALPPSMAARAYQYDDDDDDYGPPPPPSGTVVQEKDGVQEFLEKEEKRRKQIEASPIPHVYPSVLAECRIPVAGRRFLRSKVS
ncbi:hypothetical protein POSPLADRAFT_1043184 [Postia placenta MAD-698-R-SB12]|uniref:DUF6533 domain-containing protein n=1 Tax=Postia placenta MAD-698-R-SB12 TaxID=670580 RepID=A0A1X6NHW5_9APHY|nr:hypothetical protein POSPLADRAFT_1043184 [Postia placenta MAD-698-R-SB12]OSX68026.1 hypothetical protein POSPLADRAFT_1043184 [Postia placenta MAD-698-R-SB12]